MPDHRDAHRRRLAALRRLQAGPATWQEIVEAVGPAQYGVEAGADFSLNGSEDRVRFAVHHDLDWLREIGCEISFRRGRPGTGGRYVLEKAPVEMPAAPLRLDGAQSLALNALERQWSGEEGEVAQAVRSLLALVREAGVGQTETEV